LKSFPRLGYYVIKKYCRRQTYNDRKSKNIRPFFAYQGGKQSGPIFARSNDPVGAGGREEADGQILQRVGSY